MSRLRVVRAGSYVPDFRRNRQVERLLDVAGFDVTEERIDLWPDDRVSAARGGKARTILKAPASYARLMYRLARMKRPDLVIVGYPGWFDIPIVALVCRLRKIPVLFDMFFSIYDTAVLDRELFEDESLVARLLRLADTWACRLADRIILDTEPHATFIAEMTGVKADKFGILPLGADESLFYPREATVDPKRVTFHGTFVPLQGLATVIEAAAELQQHDIDFLLIGDGQDSQLVDELIGQLGLTNVERTGLLPLDRIPLLLAETAVVLGIFGDSGKADRVVPNKLYEGLAMQRPVVSAATAATQWAFGNDEVVLVPNGHPKALAKAITDLIANPSYQHSQGRAGRNAFDKRYSEVRLAETFLREAEATIDAVV